MEGSNVMETLPAPLIDHSIIFDQEQEDDQDQDEELVYTFF